MVGRIAPREVVAGSRRCMQLRAMVMMDSLTLEALAEPADCVTALIGEGCMVIQLQDLVPRWFRFAVWINLPRFFTGAEASDGCSRGPDEPATAEGR